MQEKERREALHSASPSLEGVEVSVARVAELAAFWWEAHIPSLTTTTPTPLLHTSLQGGCFPLELADDFPRATSACAEELFPQPCACSPVALAAVMGKQITGWLRFQVSSPSHSHVCAS